VCVRVCVCVCVCARARVSGSGQGVMEGCRRDAPAAKPRVEAGAGWCQRALRKGNGGKLGPQAAVRALISAPRSKPADLRRADLRVTGDYSRPRSLGSLIDDRREIERAPPGRPGPGLGPGRSRGKPLASVLRGGMRIDS
jgi:hypothetical protein